VNSEQALPSSLEPLFTVYRLLFTSFAEPQ